VPVEAPAALAQAERPTTPIVGSGAASPLGSAPQELASGRRGQGDLCGAFTPADGAARTAPYGGRTPAHDAAVLAHVAAWMPPDRERVSASRDHLRAHRATDVLLVSRAHPRGEFVCQPT
jgi:hypothetical protein